MRQRCGFKVQDFAADSTDNDVIVVLQGSSNRLTATAIDSGLAGAETFQKVSEILIHLTGFGCSVGGECMGEDSGPLPKSGPIPEKGKRMKQRVFF